MKKTEKFGKALVVVIVVGIGLMHNINKKSHILNSYNPFSFSIENQSIKTDSTKTEESSLYIYTKKIINSSIQRLISNL